MAKVFDAILRYFLIPLSIIFMITAVSPATQASKKSVNGGEPIEINLYTFSPYQSLFAWYGHSAIEIKNTETGEAYMFNYGGFFFDLPHFIEYLKGRFEFWSFVLESNEALIPYENQNRHIVVQTLNLTSQQKTMIQKLLVNSLQPGNRYYNYNHFLDNCSTRIRDIIDEALGGDLKKQSLQASNLTFRDYMHRMMAEVPVLDFAMLFIANDFVDQPISDWDTMFLPDRLMAVIERAKNPDIPVSNQNLLVIKRIDRNIGMGIPYFDAEAQVVNTMIREGITGILLMLLLVLTGLFYFRSRSASGRLYSLMVSVFGLVFGLCGTILFILMLFTQHQDTYWNENILLLNPATLLLFPLGLAAVFGRAAKWFHRAAVFNGLSALVAICVKLLPAFDQANGQHFRILIPSLLVIGFIGVVALKKDFYQNDKENIS
jgi:Domain of unknown function (DUF4105)